MSIAVLKFGGTSLANTKLMKNAVLRVVEHVKKGDQVIVVVSAMAGVTDHLVGLVNEITSCGNIDSWAEYANIITTGEQVSAGLFSLFLQNEGIKARSWLGWQLGIITDKNLSNGDIIKLECEKLLDAFSAGYQVAVVTGFQGVTQDKRISTLGRGGSDTSAIVLAGHLKAKTCDIYTDVEGVFTGDPRIIAKARKIDKISYDQMITFARAGAKVLQEKSVEWAKHFNVNVQVLSSFTGVPGTIITSECGQKEVLGVSLSDKTIGEVTRAKISVIGENIGNNSILIEKLKRSLEKGKINVFLFEFSPLIVSFIIEEELKFDAVKLLHHECELD